MYLSNQLVNNIDFDVNIYNEEYFYGAIYAKDILPLYAVGKAKDLFFDKNHYILYWYSGTKIPDDHNCIITDENFKRIKCKIDTKILTKKYDLSGTVPTNKFPSSTKIGLVIKAIPK